jgi:hypothetical protein
MSLPYRDTDVKACSDGRTFRQDRKALLGDLVCRTGFQACVLWQRCRLIIRRICRAHTACSAVVTPQLLDTTRYAYSVPVFERGAVHFVAGQVKVRAVRVSEFLWCGKIDQGCCRSNGRLMNSAHFYHDLHIYRILRSECRSTASVPDVE